MTLTIDKTKDGYRISVHEAGRNVASGSGASVKEAAQWLCKQINRVVEQAEACIVDAGLLSHAEVRIAASYGAEKGDPTTCAHRIVDRSRDFYRCMDCGDDIGKEDGVDGVLS